MALVARRNGAAGDTPRLRIKADDLVPERRAVLEIEEADGSIRVVEGYAWGNRCPGTVEARTLQRWNRDRDLTPGSETFGLIVGEPDFVAFRVREAMEEAVLDLCDTLTPTEVSVMQTTDLGRILEELGFLLPKEGAEIDLSDEEEGEGITVPPEPEASASSEAESTTPTPTT